MSFVNIRKYALAFVIFPKMQKKGFKKQKVRTRGQLRFLFARMMRMVATTQPLCLYEETFNILELLAPLAPAVQCLAMLGDDTIWCCGQNCFFVSIQNVVPIPIM